MCSETVIIIINDVTFKISIYIIVIITHNNYCVCTTVGTYINYTYVAKYSQM